MTEKSDILRFSENIPLKNVVEFVPNITRSLYKKPL